MVLYQDTSECECVDPPICPPPGGGNGGDILLPTECGIIPIINGPSGPEPPNPGGNGGPIKTGSWDGDDDPPWPPEPPRLTGPVDSSGVWICTGWPPNRICRPMTVQSANVNWPNRVHHATQADCQVVCINEDPPPGSTITVAPGGQIPGGAGGSGGTGGGTPVVYWVCSGWPSYTCNRITQNLSVPPPAGAYTSQAMCVAKCKGGPITGGPRVVKTWWVCSSYPEYKCTSITVPITTPPPQGAYGTKDECEAKCKKGPITGGGAFGSPTLGTFSENNEGGANGSTVGNQGSVTGVISNSNSNLPTQVVPNNALDPYSGGVYRPETIPNSNIPAPPTSNILPKEANILGVENVVSNSLPTVPTVEGSKNTYDSAAARQVAPFVEYLKFDPSMKIYDTERSISVQTAVNILKRADMRTKKFGDPNDIFNERIKTTLNDILRSKGGSSYVPFNGVTVGSYMLEPLLIEKSINQPTINALDFVKYQNLFSLELDTYLKNGVKESILKGTSNEYTIQLIKEMGSTSKVLWPLGLPRVANTNRREAAYNLIRQSRRSLNPNDYKEDGNSQQIVRRMRQVPTDIDLTLPIVTRKGKVTGARFSNDDGLHIVTTSGTYGKPKQENEFFGIGKLDGTTAHVELKSNRDIAYAFNSNQDNVIKELLNSRSFNTFEVSSSAPSPYDVEVSSVSRSIPEIMVFSSMRETIDSVSDNSHLRTTNVTYELAWKTGDADNIFDTVVSGYVGPRATFYIASDDPIWNYILSPLEIEPGDPIGRSFIKATFESLNTPLDGKVYPRQIYTDFALAPTNVIRYDPLQGGSVLSSYATGEPIKRTITLAPSPLQSVQDESYVKSVRDNTDISGEKSRSGMKWTRNFTDGEYTQRLSMTQQDFSTSQSPFGIIYNTIKNIDSNYNLQDGYQGKRLPKGDLISFLTLKQFIEMNQIPKDIRFRLFNGAYNNVKIYPALKDAIEKTYITADRLTGTDLSSQQVQTIVPELPYFDSRYKGKLY